MPPLSAKKAKTTAVSDTEGFLGSITKRDSLVESDSDGDPEPVICTEEEDGDTDLSDSNSNQNIMPAAKRSSKSSHRYKEKMWKKSKVS